MKEMLNDIFEVKDIVWFAMGVAVPYILNKGKNFIDWVRMHRRLRKEDIHFDNEGIVSLMHGDPFFEVGGQEKDLKLDAPQESFYISMPLEIKERIIQVRDNFFNTKWEKDQVFFDNQNEDDMLREVSVIIRKTFDETKMIYNEEKKNVALFFEEKARNGEPYFIGEMYGIKKLVENREGVFERPTAYIQSYKTDYYTHRVMAAIYRRIYQADKEIVPENTTVSFNKMRYFLTSMGMNVLIYLKDEDKLVFTKRSGKLVNMIKSLWHVSMNEAISITDISESSNAIDLGRCVERGLNEELGFNKSILSIKYGDLFFLKDPFETGISAFVTISNCSFSELKILYSAAKDKELESENLIAINFKVAEIKKFMKTNELTEAAQYVISMLLARRIKGAI